MARSRIRTRKTSDHFWAPPSFFSRFPPQNLGAYYVPSHSSEVDFCALTVAFDMIHDSASHRVLKIGELTRVIASHLVAISRKSVVNLACSCRYLEEPVLSTLWETQPLLITLLMTLPEDTWAQWENPEHGIEVCGLNLDLLLEESITQVWWATSVWDRKGSTTGGLEQSPALRVLDAQSPMVNYRRGDLPHVTCTLTRWRVVPSVTRFVLGHHGTQHRSHGPVLLSAFEEGHHECGRFMGKFWCSPRYPTNHYLDPLRITDICSRTPGYTCRSAWGTMDTFQRVVLLYHFALRAIAHKAQLPGPIIRRGGKPSGSTPPSPYLVHGRPSAELSSFTFAPRFPISHGPYTPRQCRMWMASPFQTA